MHWILIMWMAASQFNDAGIAIDHIHFESQAACKAAFAQVKAVNSGAAMLSGACVEDK